MHKIITVCILKQITQRTSIFVGDSMFAGVHITIEEELNHTSKAYAGQEIRTGLSTIKPGDKGWYRRPWQTVFIIIFRSLQKRIIVKIFSFFRTICF